MYDYLHIAPECIPGAVEKINQMLVFGNEAAPRIRALLDGVRLLPDGRLPEKTDKAIQKIIKASPCGCRLELDIRVVATLWVDYTIPTAPGFWRGARDGICVADIDAYGFFHIYRRPFLPTPLFDAEQVMSLMQEYEAAYEKARRAADELDSLSDKLKLFIQ